VSQKTIHLAFDHNFDKCRPNFKIPKETLCKYSRAFHLTLIVFLHYLAKIKNLTQRLNFYQGRLSPETMVHSPLQGGRMGSPIFDYNAP